jgi:hypothetical protein
MKGIGSELPRCERKQDAGRSLVPWQHALKDHWLIDNVAAAEVTDRDYQTRATAPAVTKSEFARIRPSAAMLSLGMCPEPAPIEADDILKWARRHDCVLPSKRVWAAARRPHQLRSLDT